MIDIETMGTRIGSPILQIGAVYFDWDGNTYKEFRTNIELADSIDKGFIPQGETVEWWMKQNNSARHGLFYQTKPLRTALTAFNMFIKNNTRVWSHATFDFVHIVYAMEKVGIKPKMHWRQAMDIRTMVALSRVKPSSVSRYDCDAHNALIDCYRQIDYLCMCNDQVKPFAAL